MDLVRDRILTGGGRRIVCQHEWRHDFVGEALTINLDEAEAITKVEFYSATHGIVSWLAGRGLGIPRRWEDSEESNHQGAFSSMHSAALLLACKDDRASAAIIDEVVSHLAHTPLADLISRTLASPQERHVLEHDHIETAWPPSQLASPDSDTTANVDGSSFVGRLLRAVLKRGGPGRLAEPE